jgi:hypothetical protein
MNESTKRRWSPAMVVALAALVMAAGAVVFALAGNATAGGGPALRVQQKTRDVGLAANEDLARTVSCPSGFKVVSGSSDFDLGVSVTSSHRVSGRKWLFSGHGDSSGPSDWVLYVICAKVS